MKGDASAYRQESARLEVPSHGPGDLMCSACYYSVISPGCSPVLASLKLVGLIQFDRWWSRRLRKFRPGASQLCGRLTDCALQGNHRITANHSPKHKLETTDTPFVHIHVTYYSIVSPPGNQTIKRGLWT